MLINTYIVRGNNASLEFEKRHDGEFVIYLTFPNGDRVRYHTDNPENAKHYFKRMFREVRIDD